jgi:hypothetical protein
MRDQPERMIAVSDELVPAKFRKVIPGRCHYCSRQFFPTSTPAGRACSAIRGAGMVSFAAPATSHPKTAKVSRKEQVIQKPPKAFLATDLYR